MAADLLIFIRMLIFLTADFGCVTVTGHGIGGKVIPAKMAQLAES